MAFCMLKIHSGVSKPASKLVLPNCNLSRNVLRDVSELSDSLRWSTYSALLSRPVPGYNDKKNQSSAQLTTPKTPERLSAKDNLQQKSQLQSISKDCNSLGKLSVNLTELYACDPLAILLHSRLQIYNNSLLGQREEVNKTKGQKRTPRHEDLPTLQVNTSSRCPHPHDALANQRTTSPLSAASSISGRVVAPFPAYREAIVSSCTLGSGPSPPTPRHAMLPGSSSLYQKQTLAGSSLHQCGPPLPKPDADQCRGQAPGSGGGGKVNPHGLPTPEQLRLVHDTLIESLRQLFVQSGNYKIYDPDIIFENRIRGTVTKGISMYAMQMSLLVTLGHLKHAHVRFDIIKITQHPEEGTIKVRWRIKGVKSRQAFVGFLKAPKWSVSSVEQGDSTNWYDGFSTFYVNSAGKVSRHVADNMMPDDDKVSSSQKTSLLGRLAVLFGLLPKAGHGNAIVGG